MLDRHILPEGQQLLTILQSATSLQPIQAALANLPVFNMMNTKFLIINNEAPVPNPHALGNAWFVDSYIIVKTPNEEINGVRGINPRQKAIIHEEFADDLAGLTIQKNGTIKLTDYKPNHLTYTSNSTSDQLAIYSEVWYGPDKGWNAYIDGQEVDHIRANYILRGLKVPAGQHTIEFKFEPGTYAFGSTISLISSLILLLGLLAFLYFYFKKEMEEPEPEKEKVSKASQSKTVSKTKSKRNKKK